MILPFRLPLLGLPLLAALAQPVSALDLTAMTEAETAAFGDAVRAYLLENPQILIEVIGILERREAETAAQMDQALVAQYSAEVFDDGHSWVGGNPDGDVTLVEFIDYRCGYCRRAFQEVEELLAADGNIRFIVKEYPILGPQSELSASFAIAVHQIHGDQIYEDVHNALMVLESDVTPESLAALAEGFALDPSPIMERMTGSEVRAVLDANRALGAAMQINGTPTFILNDQMVRGYVPLAQMQALVADQRSAD